MGIRMVIPCRLAQEARNSRAAGRFRAESDGLRRARTSSEVVNLTGPRQGL